MANKKWLRIVWDDELWRDMEVPHANRKETNIDTISLSDPDWDDMHRADVVAGTHDRNESMAESSDSYPEQSDLKKQMAQMPFYTPHLKSSFRLVAQQIPMIPQIRGKMIPLM